VTAAQPDAADHPPFQPDRLLNAPFPDRVRMVCQSWADQEGYFVSNLLGTRNVE